MAKIKMEVCLSNLKLGSKQVYDHVTATYPDVRLRRFACIGQCHICNRQPFVLMDDHTYLEAPTADELEAQVNDYIRTRSAG